MIEELNEREKAGFVRLTKPEKTHDRAVHAGGMWWPNSVCRVDAKGVIWAKKSFYDKKVNELVEGLDG